MILEAAVAAFLATTEWRNGGDNVQRFVVPGSPYVSTVTRRLGATAGVIYDADGHAQDLDGATARQIPHCIALAPAADGTVQAMGRERAVRPERVVVDLMELYTLAAENGAGGQAQIEAKIAAAVDLLNSALLNSRVDNVTFRLVYTGRIDRDESLSQQAMLIWLTNDPGVAQLRAQYAADLVGLWTEEDAEIAWAPRTFTPSSGFHLICRRYPLSLQLFSHEVAHNLGAQHNAGQVGSIPDDPYPFARGFCGATSMSIMSYPPDGQWRDVMPLFSSPDLQPDGTADNARMLRIGGPVVADYMK